MHAEDAARVLAGGAGLAAEAGREAGVAQRQAIGVEDLFVVQRGERDLGGADQVELIRGQAVDLLLGVGQEAGPEQRALAHQHRRDHRLEAVRAQPLQDPAHERQLEQHEIAFQVGEARAGELRGVVHVDHRTRELQVIAGFEGRLEPIHPTHSDLSHYPHLLVLGAGGSGGVGEVGEPAAGVRRGALWLGRPALRAA